MYMSKAALPPRTGLHSKADEAHPLFKLYQQHVTSCRRNLINSSDFRDWLSCYELQQLMENAAKHPNYPEFLKWMRENQGGARRCPVGAFPHNFKYWMDGGRW